MAGEFEEVLKLTIEDGDVSAFVAKIMAAFDAIADGAKKAYDEGEKVGPKGRSQAYRQATEHVTRQIGTAGLSDSDSKRWLSEVQKGNQEIAKRLSRADGNFRPPKYILSESARKSDRGDNRNEQRWSQYQNRGGDEKGPGDTRRERDRARNKRWGYEDVDPEDRELSPLEMATRAKRNSAKFNNDAAKDPAYRAAAAEEALGLKRTNTAYNNSLVHGVRVPDVDYKKPLTDSEGNPAGYEPILGPDGKQTSTWHNKGGAEYKQAHGDQAVSAKEREALENAALTTQAYARANAAAAITILDRQRVEENAKTESERYVTAEAGLAADMNRQKAEIAKAKTGSSSYKSSVVESATQSKLQDAAEDSAKNTRVFSSANEEAARAALELKTALEAAKTGSEQYIEAEVGAAKQLLARQTALAEAKLADSDYAKNTAGAAATMAALKAKEAEAVAATDSYIAEARTKLATTRQARNVQAQVLGGTTEEDTRQQGAVQAGEASQKLATKLAELQNVTDDDIAKTALLAATTAALALKQAEATAATGAWIDEGNRKAVDARTAGKVKAGTLAATTGDDLEQKGVNETVEARQKVTSAMAALAAHTAEDTVAEVGLASATKARTAALTTAQTTDEQYIQATAAAIVAQNEQTAAIKAKVAEMGGGPSKKGGLFQKALQHFDPKGSERDTSSYRTLGQFAGQHATNTAGYLVPGLVFGVGLEELSKSVTEAEKAQMVFAELNAQFAALGQSSQLSGFTDSIKSISDNTGLAVSEVGELAMAMKGVYGSTAQAEIALTGVAEAAVAMGLSTEEAQEDLTAITQTFSQFANTGGAAITQVSNEMLHLQDVTGVDAKDILSGTAQAGASTNAIGMSYSQTAAIVAEGVQKSGYSSDDIGQTLSKAVDGLTQNYAQVYAVYQNSPNLQGEIPTLNKDTTAQAMTQILGDFQKMPGALQVTLERSLGLNASSTPYLNAISKGISKSGPDVNTPAPADRTAEEFKKQMDTVEGSFDKLRQDVVNLGVGLLDSGFGTALTTTADALGDVSQHIGQLNKDTDGLAGKFAELGVGLVAFKVLIGGIKTAGAILGIGSKTNPGVVAADALKGSAVSLDRSAAAIIEAAEVSGGKGVLTGGKAATTVEEDAGRGGFLGKFLGKGGGAEASEGGGLFGRGEGTAALGADSALGAEAGLGSVASLPALAAGVGGYVAGTEIDKHLLGGKKGWFQQAANSLFGASNVPAGYDTKGIGIAMGTNPYQDAYGDKVGHYYTAKQTAAAGSVRGSIEAELAKMMPNLTAQQQYSVKTDETAAGKGSEAAWLNLEQMFTTLGNNPTFKKIITQGQVANQTAAANAQSALDIDKPQAGKVFNNQRAQAAAVKNATNAQNKVIADAVKADNGANSDWTGIQTAYSAGAVSFATLVSYAKSNVTAAQAAMNPKSGTPGTTAYEALQTAIQAQNQILDTAVSDQVAANQALAQTGNVTSDAANVNALAASIGNLKEGSAKYSAAQGIVTGMQTEIQDQDAAATSLSQQLAINAKGITATQTQLAAYNQAMTAMGLKTVKSLTVYGPAATATTASAGLNQKTQAIQSQAVASAREDPVGIAIANYNAAKATLANDVASGYGPGSSQYQTDAAAAQTAAQTLVDSQNQVKEASDQLRQTQATSNGNGMEAATAAVQLAEQQLADAHGLAAQKAAQGNLSTANAAYASAATDLMLAKAATASALATEQGSPVEAAEVTYAAAVKAMKARAAYDVSHGNKNPANDTTYQADVATAYNDAASVLSAQVSNLENIGQMELFLGQITATEYIAQLEAELASVEKYHSSNKAEILTIQQEIRQTQNSAGGDLDFDIPSNLLISPTLYQAQRASQGGGASYDNRTVTVAIVVNNASHNTAAVTALLAAIGAPNGGTSTATLPTAVLSSR